MVRDRITSFSIQAEILNAILQVMSDFDDVCHSIRNMKKLPMQNYPPVYGQLATTYRDYAFPAWITALAFIFPLFSTLSGLLPERLGGTLERSLASGVEIGEVAAAHFNTNFPFMGLQVLVLLIIPYKIFDLYMVGNVWIPALLLWYIGIAGIIFGKEKLTLPGRRIDI